MSKGSRTAYGGRIIAGSNPASRISRNSSVVEQWGVFPSVAGSIPAFCATYPKGMNQSPKIRDAKAGRK